MVIGISKLEKSVLYVRCSSTIGRAAHHHYMTVGTLTLFCLKVVSFRKVGCKRLEFKDISVSKPQQSLLVRTHSVKDMILEYRT